MLRKTKGKANSVAEKTARGVIIAVLVTLAGALVMGKLVDKQIMRMESVGYGAMAVIGISAWLAAVSAMNAMQEKRYLNAAMGSGCYFAVLLGINALFFGGTYPGFWSGLVAAMTGMVAAVFTTGKGSGKGHRKRYKIPR